GGLLLLVAGACGSRRPLLRTRLPPELLFNRRRHELHDRRVVRHVVQLQATVKLLRDAGRQLRPDFLGHRHQAAFFFDPAGRPGPRRRLRRRRPFFAFARGVTIAFFFRAAFSATAFGGRPGPPGRHFPRALRRRRRPFFAFGLLLATLPSNDWIAELTSC